MQTMPAIGRTIEKELFIAVSPERVYRAFTTKDELERWFVTSADVELRPGGAYNLWWREDHTSGQYVELDPPHKLVFTWDEGPKHGITTCTIELIPENDGTLLRLTHTGFLDGDNWDALYDGVSRGWTMELDHLKTWLETGVEKSWT